MNETLKNEDKKMVHDIPGAENVSPQRGPPKTPCSKKPSGYVYDSNGDTRIILSTSIAQTFKWKTDKIWIREERSRKAYNNWKWEKNKGKTVEVSPPTTPPAPEESPVTTLVSPGGITDRTTIDWDKSDFSDFSNVQYCRPEFSDADDTNPDCTNAGTSPDITSLQTKNWEYGETYVPHLKKMEFRMLASGKHLELASPIFKTMVTGPFAEGKADALGFRLITASDWDHEAFKIVLAIIHGYNRDVPRSLGLEMLVKVAMVVNYYDCLESVEPYTDIWLDGLKSELPTRLHSQKLIEAEDFPIPAEIFEGIDIERQSALAEILSAIYELFDRLQEGQECSFECSSMLLGILTKELSQNGIMYPRKTPPFHGFSIEGFKELIKGFKKPGWYNTTGHSSYGDCNHRKHGCCIQDKLSVSLAKVQSDLRVFDLQDFQATKKHTCS
ncbi:hypothetical protein FNAPI_5537 [Fusarium napiforme]|uniref:BTB domain-containing protein n=1 Tax=Fusarium napiforme TaxID=42672 RepID=A0A8H5JKK8_9HYPO|nr:hypothetical protein FNAPI_5537 [Fusarium napiforme]